MDSTLTQSLAVDVSAGEEGHGRSGQDRASFTWKYKAYQMLNRDL